MMPDDAATLKSNTFPPAERAGSLGTIVNGGGEPGSQSDFKPTKDQPCMPGVQ